MTDEKQNESHFHISKNESMEILPLDSNLLLPNASFNFFESTHKKNQKDSQGE